MDRKRERLTPLKFGVPAPDCTRCSTRLSDDGRRFRSPLSACNPKRWRTMGEGCAATVPLPRIARSSAARGSQAPRSRKKGVGWIEASGCLAS